MSLNEPDPERQLPPPAAPSVLIVDDDETLRSQLSTYLDSHGIPCLLAETGGEALEALAKHRFDAVVLDVRLPDMSGLEVAARIGQMSPRPKIILMSGYDDAVREAMQADIEIFKVIEKPVPLWHVARTIDQALDLVV